MRMRFMPDLLKRFRSSVRFAFKNHVMHNVSPVDRWFHDHGDDTLALQYALTSSSVVFEVGGFKGAWSSKIVELYDPNLYIFEPVAEYFQSLSNRFSKNAKARVFQFGLGSRDAQVECSLAKDGSGMYAESCRRESILLRDIEAFAKDNGIEAIDLIQINIEGGEYDLLRRMLDTGLASRCRQIRIQFHDVLPDAIVLRYRIQQELSQTHNLVYDYPFVWESWTAKPGCSEC